MAAAVSEEDRVASLVVTPEFRKKLFGCDDSDRKTRTLDKSVVNKHQFVSPDIFTNLVSWRKRGLLMMKSVYTFFDDDLSSRINGLETELKNKIVAERKKFHGDNYLNIPIASILGAHTAITDKDQSVVQLRVARLMACVHVLATRPCIAFIAQCFEVFQIKIDDDLLFGSNVLRLINRMSNGQFSTNDSNPSLDETSKISFRLGNVDKSVHGQLHSYIESLIADCVSADHSHFSCLSSTLLYITQMISNVCQKHPLLAKLALPVLGGNLLKDVIENRFICTTCETRLERPNGSLLSVIEKVTRAEIKSMDDMELKMNFDYLNCVEHHSNTQSLPCKTPTCKQSTNYVHVTMMHELPLYLPFSVKRLDWSKITNESVLTVGPTTSGLYGSYRVVGSVQLGKQNDPNYQVICNPLGSVDKNEWMKIDGLVQDRPNPIDLDFVLGETNSFVPVSHVVEDGVVLLERVA